jgi:hypothetical protein
MNEDKCKINMDVNKEVKEEINRILKNAIKDILTHGCGSLPCVECPLFNSVTDSANDKLCDAIGDC